MIAAGDLKYLLDPYVIERPLFYLYDPEQNRRLELLRLYMAFLRIERGEPTRESLQQSD